MPMAGVFYQLPGKEEKMHKSMARLQLIGML